MVRINYLGINDPVATFERYRVWRDELEAMKSRCFPFKPDYLALDGIVRALDVAAIHFTKNPDFYVPQYAQPRFHKSDEEYPRD
jgi:hypothetical protein